MKKLKTGVTTTEVNGIIEVDNTNSKSYDYYNSEERKISETESSIIVFVCLALFLIGFMGVIISHLIGWI